MGYFYFRILALVYFSLHLFILLGQVLCLVYVFVFGRSFLCLVGFSQWESPVLGYVDVKSR